MIADIKKLTESIKRDLAELNAEISENNLSAKAFFTKCEDFIYLQEERHSADYDIAKNFRKQDANLMIQRAERFCSSVLNAESDCCDELDALLLDCLSVKSADR